ncbi:hypothetical protein G7046_g154 [Stylonectria norvegica]|nr:hypothetical protein G7046_g154 [Stylonectria norvegica]
MWCMERADKKRGSFSRVAGHLLKFHAPQRRARLNASTPSVAWGAEMGECPSAPAPQCPSECPSGCPSALALRSAPVAAVELHRRPMAFAVVNDVAPLASMDPWMSNHPCRVVIAPIARRCWLRRSRLSQQFMSPSHSDGQDSLSLGPQTALSLSVSLCLSLALSLALSFAASIPTMETWILASLELFPTLAAVNGANEMARSIARWRFTYGNGAPITNCWRPRQSLAPGGGQLLGASAPETRSEKLQYFGRDIGHVQIGWDVLGMVSCIWHLRPPVPRDKGRAGATMRHRQRPAMA